MLHRDPVCGMMVDPEGAAGRTEYQDKTYYFCATSCLQRFRAEPGKYVKPQPANLVTLKRPRPGPSAPLYTCPMHPQVEQRGPGNCPICGMALEPKAISLDDKPDPELGEMARRLRISA